MRIVFPDGAGCVQAPGDLDPLPQAWRGGFLRGATPEQSGADRAGASRRRHRPRLLDARRRGARTLRPTTLHQFPGHRLRDIHRRGGCHPTRSGDRQYTGLRRHFGGRARAGPDAWPSPGTSARRSLSLREGRWEPGRFQGIELHGKTLGIVGLGPIGQEMARLGAGLGMRLLGWTRRPGRTVSATGSCSFRSRSCSASRTW